MERFWSAKCQRAISMEITVRFFSRFLRLVYSSETITVSLERNNKLVNIHRQLEAEQLNVPGTIKPKLGVRKASSSQVPLAAYCPRGG